MSNNIYGRQVVVPLTNKSGGGVIAGDTVIVDTSNNDAFTTSTAGAFTGLVGIAQETIASNATGRVLTAGYAALVNTSASVTRGNFGKTHTVAKQTVDAGSSRVAGAFCQFITGGTTPDAHLFGLADNTSGAGTGTVTTVKDEGSTLSTAVASIDFVGAGVTATGTTAVTVTIPGGGAFHGAKVYKATAQSVASAVAAIFDSEDYDTDTYHFTSAAALTGTVTKASASAFIVGSSTLFTSELSVNQVISIPGTATEIGVVKAITDNTHVELWQTMANSASGQTATRRNEYLAIPSGLGGYYRMYHQATTDNGGNGFYIDIIKKNGAVIRGANGTMRFSSSSSGNTGTTVSLAAGDYVNVDLQCQSTDNVGSTSVEKMSTLTLDFLGT